MLKFLEHLQVTGEENQKLPHVVLGITELDVTVGECEARETLGTSEWSSLQESESLDDGRGRDSPPQREEKLLAPVQHRSGFSVIRRRAVMKMRRGWDSPVNVLSRAEMGR